MENLMGEALRGATRTLPTMARSLWLMLSSTLRFLLVNETGTKALPVSSTYKRVYDVLVVLEAS